MMKQKVLLVKTDYDEGFILDMPLEDAVKIIDLMQPVAISGSSVSERLNKKFEFIIYEKEDKKEETE